MKFDELKKLHQKKHREASGHFLVEGEHLVLELQKAAARNPVLQRSELYVTRAHEHWQSPFPKHVIGDRQMAQLAETRTPQGLVAVVPMLPSVAPTSVPAGERAIYLHEVRDPGNLGTILRTLAWFGHFRCLLSPDSVDPYNSKVVRASIGALFHVPVELDVAWAALRQRFKRIASLDLRGQSVQAAAFATFDCYLFGNEARGLPAEALLAVAAEPFTIPGGGSIESLNLAAAVNICVYELSK